MSDESLRKLFAEGAVPERDVAFAARVAAAIHRERVLGWLMRAIRSGLALALLAASYLAARVVAPGLAEIAGGAPQLIGAPLPFVLGITILALLMRIRRVFRPSPG